MRGIRVDEKFDLVSTLSLGIREEVSGGELFGDV